MSLEPIWWAAVGDDDVLETVVKTPTNQIWMCGQSCIQVHSRRNSCFCSRCCCNMAWNIAGKGCRCADTFGRREPMRTAASRLVSARANSRRATHKQRAVKHCGAYTKMCDPRRKNHCCERDNLRNALQAPLPMAHGSVSSDQWECFSNAIRGKLISYRFRRSIWCITRTSELAKIVPPQTVGACAPQTEANDWRITSSLLHHGLPAKTRIKICTGTYLLTGLAHAWRPPGLCMDFTAAIQTPLNTDGAAEETHWPTQYTVENELEEDYRQTLTQMCRGLYWNWFKPARPQI